jgi:hypothetical protein
MSDIIDEINRLKNKKKGYEEQLERIRREDKDTDRITNTVDAAINNLRNNKNSFIIYGEPQSGKTEMMIALTSKLIDEDYKLVIVLVNDNVHLKEQNKDRFIEAHVTPIPVDYLEILSTEVKIDHDTQMVIFCKKNSKDLQKLLDKVDKFQRKVIIDDEADYASPDGKINKLDEQTKINLLVGNLLQKGGIYIGVTATPARLDLNNTFDNIAENWVEFKPHDFYTGVNTFFPPNPNENLSYSLKLLPAENDNPAFLEDAVASFIASVGFLNTKDPSSVKNYTMLVHKSHKIDLHDIDYGIIVKFFEALINQENPKCENRWRRVKNAIEKKYPNDVTKILEYIVNNIKKNKVLKMNNQSKKEGTDFDHATTPVVPFTVCVAGNIASRGLTFNNLLSMYFTRDAGKIQQDTYVQRARMFGSRLSYLSEFELTIPDYLYDDWHKCFLMHSFSLASIKSNKTVPTWVGDSRVTPVAKNSIDLQHIDHKKGEMSFEIFDYDDDVNNIIHEENNMHEKLIKLHEKLGDKHLPYYILMFVEHSLPMKDKSIAIHNSASIEGFNSGGVDKLNIARPRGFMGRRDLEIDKYPHAIHHFKIFYNKDMQARVFYIFNGKHSIIRNLKHHKV